MMSILFVCLGNICRSPAAEAVLRHRNGLKNQSIEIYVESCGVGDWHVGQLPVEQMRKAAEKRSIVLSSRAQQFSPNFFDRFDYILAADRAVMAELYGFAKNPEQQAKIHLISEYSDVYFREDIPDPYAKEDVAFELVLDMLESSCEGLLRHLELLKLDNNCTERVGPE